jgi:hypothetical protein
MCIDKPHFIVYTTHMNDNDIDHLCKMLKESHDTACKVSGFTDTMFLQALEGVIHLRQQRDEARKRLSECAMNMIARLDEEIESRR